MNFYLFLVAILFNLVVVLMVYVKLMKKIENIYRKDLDEINGEMRNTINRLMIEFNSTAKTNVELLESRIAEMKSLLEVVERKGNASVREDKSNALEKIMRSVREGHSLKQIARESKYSVGELELILNITEKQRNASVLNPTGNKGMN